MPKFIFVFVLISVMASADEISVPMTKSKAKPGDTISFAEGCEPKDVPVNQEGAKVELNGKQGKVLIGAAWTGVRVSKGYESYDLAVIHGPDEDPINLVKSGKFKVTGTPLHTDGCRHSLKFKIFSADANPPCGSGQENAPAAR